MSGRGLAGDHTTVFRRVRRYAPEINRRRRPHLEPASGEYVGRIRGDREVPGLAAARPPNLRQGLRRAGGVRVGARTSARSAPYLLGRGAGCRAPTSRPCRPTRALRWGVECHLPHAGEFRRRASSSCRKHFAIRCRYDE